MKIQFFPAELGGAADPENIGYITPQAATDRARIIETLERRIEQDQVDRMEVVADYKGDSIIPSRIRLRAWHSRSGQSFEMAIEVW